jgi:hypothetical protein
MKYLTYVALATLWGVFAEALLLASAGIPINNGFVIFALGFQLITFPSLVFLAERKSDKKRIIATGG